MKGDQSLFARADMVELAWKIVDPILERGAQGKPHDRGTWGPDEAHLLIQGDAQWHDPIVKSG